MTNYGVAYGLRRVLAEDSMEFWLRQVAVEYRGNEKLIHVASRADVSEGSISRFEAGKSWPRDLDRTLEAYARPHDLHAIDLWTEALRRWREWLAKPDRTQREEAAQAFEAAAEAEAQQRTERSSSTGAKRRSGDGRGKRQ